MTGVKEQFCKNEIRIGSDVLELRENNIIRATVVGKQTMELAFEIKKACRQLTGRIEGEYHYLLDLNRSGNNVPVVREVWKHLCTEERVGKVAAFGQNKVAEVVANFVIGSCREQNMSFFLTEKEALDWIKNDGI